LALPVNIITNDEIERRVRFHAEDHPLSAEFPGYIKEHGFKELADNWLGMPYWEDSNG
jgi:hypothetical protein